MQFRSQGGLELRINTQIVDIYSEMWRLLFDGDLNVKFSLNCCRYSVRFFLNPLLFYLPWCYMHHLHLRMRNIVPLWIYDEKTSHIKTQVHLLSPPTLCRNRAAAVNSARIERVPRFPHKERSTSRYTLGLPKDFKIQAVFKQNIGM